MKRAHLTWGGGNSAFQVVVRECRLHPTKGWRCGRDHIQPFDSYDEAVAYAKEINDG